MLKRLRFFPCMLLILFILSNVCLAAANTLPWDTPLEKFVGTVDSLGNLDTSGALFTDILPRIITGIMIVAAVYMYMTGEMSAEKTTIMRIIVSAGFILNLSLYFNQNFFDVSYSGTVASAPSTPDPTKGNFLGTFMTYFIWFCQQGAERLYPYVAKLVIGLAALDVATTLLLKLEDDIIKFMIQATIKYGILLWILSNWIGGIGLAHAMYSSFETMGFIISNEDTNLMPDSIVSNAFTIISDAVDRFSAADGIMTTIIAGLMIIFTIVCVVIIAAQLFLVRVEFWILALLCMVCVAFGAFRHFRFLFEKAIGTMFNVSMKLLVLTFIMTLINPMITTVLDDYSQTEGIGNLAGLLQVLLTCFILALLVLRVPALVQALLNGSPNLSASDAVAPLRATSQAINKIGSTYNQTARLTAYVKAASQMEGGKAETGIPGLTGTFGTLRNLGKIAGQRTVKGAYDDKLGYIRANLARRAENSALNTAYNEQSNPANRNAVDNNINKMNKDKVLEKMREGEMPQARNIYHDHED